MIVVAHRLSRNLTVVDAQTRDALQTIPLAGSPNSLSVSTDGVHVVSANVFEENASIASLPLGQEIATVAVNHAGTKAAVPVTSGVRILDLWGDMMSVRDNPAASVLQVVFSCPCSGRNEISLALPQSGATTLVIYDVTGRLRQGGAARTGKVVLSR